VALGAWRDQTYAISTHQLAPGDTLLFYTDGVTEALDERNRFDTAGRLRSVFAGLKQESVERITRTIMSDVRAFAGDAGTGRRPYDPGRALERTSNDYRGGNAAPSHNADYDIRG
jgi:hypothetical protein